MRSKFDLLLREEMLVFRPDMFPQMELGNQIR